MKRANEINYTDETDTAYLDTIFDFVKASVDALGTIKGYGKAEFLCPLCGSKSYISKSRGNGMRTGIWSQCDGCGMKIIS